MTDSKLLFNDQISVPDLAEGFVEFPRATLKVELPRHWYVEAEELAAISLGGNRYQLHSIPGYAYGLNYLDIVEATADVPDGVPIVRQVLGRSGHSTIRAILYEKKSVEELQSIFATLMAPKMIFQWFDNETMAAITVFPSRLKLQDVLPQLDELQRNKVLEYETGFERSPGSFDGPGFQ